LSYGGNPGDNEVMTLVQDGNVGIGTPSPQERLDVNGNIRVSGDIVLTGADCAEEFGCPQSLEVDPGTVMVIDNDENLCPSETAYDSRVAGVAAGAGDLKSGIVMDRRDSRESRIAIALVGKVYCKVDADHTPIALGDLLTTSNTPGHAMKASDRRKAFGAIVGKALRPMMSGQGLIPILVALQ